MTKWKRYSTAKLKTVPQVVQVVQWWTWSAGKAGYWTLRLGDSGRGLAGDTNVGVAVVVTVQVVAATSGGWLVTLAEVSGRKLGTMCGELVPIG